MAFAPVLPMLAVDDAGEAVFDRFIVAMPASVEMQQVLQMRFTDSSLRIRHAQLPHVIQR